MTSAPLGILFGMQLVIVAANGASALHRPS
jgi:hypothetical protein